MTLIPFFMLAMASQWLRQSFRWAGALVLCLHFALTAPVGAQVVAQLVNPSFEGAPKDATVPVGWHKCAPGSTPDILPGPWGVYTEPSDGETFVGLITRSDGSFESIGQRLSVPLKAGECYRFTIDLAHSGTYAGHSLPIKLRIWGGAGKCGKGQLLLQTDLVEHRRWKTYQVRFTAEQDIRYLTLEAFYSEGSFSREGNILLDNLSAIRRCPRA